MTREARNVRNDAVASMGVTAVRAKQEMPSSKNHLPRDTAYRQLQCLKTCEEVGVVKRVHLLSGEVRRVATALKIVEEVQEEVQEVKDE